MTYDYLLANLKLYFDRFEKELSADVQEPESDEYNQAKQADDIPDEPVDDLNLFESTIFLLFIPIILNISV